VFACTCSVVGAGFGACRGASTAFSLANALHVLQFDALDAGRGAIEMNPLWVSYNRLYHVGRPGAWWEVPLATKLGVTFTGAALNVL
jgi:hypothetical protein